MQNSLRLPVAVFCACAVLSTSGCATMRYPKTYKVDGTVFKEFKELDDEKALKLVVLICNVKHVEWEDNMARSIALKEYIGLLEKRKSAYLKKSGIFKFEYERVNLRSWADNDLMNLYDSLVPKAEGYYLDVAPKLNDFQNAERIAYLTALSAIGTEMKRRNNTRNVVTFTSQILVGALSVALSML